MATMTTTRTTTRTRSKNRNRSRPGILTASSSSSTFKTFKTQKLTVNDDDKGHKLNQSQQKTPPQENKSHSQSMIQNQNHDSNTNNNNNPRKARAIVEMAVASAIHFAGFELARSGTMALFTSSKTGFSNPSAAPISIVCVTPFSYLLLSTYTKSIQSVGPRKSLYKSTLAFAAIMAISAMAIPWLEARLDTSDDDDDKDNDTTTTSSSTTMILFAKFILQATIFTLHVVESGFVQLLSTQHWSFLGSVCGSNGVVWFSPIAGIGSVTSTIAAMSVSPLVDRVGLAGLLGVAAMFLMASAVAADDAYRIATEDELLESPTTTTPRNNSSGPKTRKPSSLLEKSSSTSNSKSSSSNNNNTTNTTSLFSTSIALFERVPILAKLCVEVLTCQCVSAIINFLFVMKLKECITNDQQRARWMGTCYAWINAASGFLQFAVLPILLKSNDKNTNDDNDKNQQNDDNNNTNNNKTTSNNNHDTMAMKRTLLWLIMPTVMMICATLMTYQTTTSLHMVATTFALYKALDYSVRGVTMEMVFVSLDYESRFIGKEIIGVFVNRFGRSAMAVVLSFAANNLLESSSSSTDNDDGVGLSSDKIFIQALSVSSLLWFYVSYPLSQRKEDNNNKVE